jgi:hypothetical protein
MQGRREGRWCVLELFFLSCLAKGEGYREEGKQRIKKWEEREENGR